MCKWEGKIEIVDKSIEDPGLGEVKKFQTRC